MCLCRKYFQGNMFILIMASFIFIYSAKIMESVAVDADRSTVSYLVLFMGLPLEGLSTLKHILL